MRVELLFKENTSGSGYDSGGGDGYCNSAGIPRYWYNEVDNIIRWSRMSKEEAEARIKYHMKDFKVVVTYHGD